MDFLTILKSFVDTMGATVLLPVFIFIFALILGVLGSTRHSYSAQILVEQMAQKIGGEGTYLFSPFIVENEKTAASLLKDPTVEKAVSIGKECDIALMGIGTTKSEFCSLYKENHISLQDIKTIRAADAVGDVCAIYFDIEGNLAPIDFHQRRIGTSLVLRFSQGQLVCLMSSQIRSSQDVSLQTVPDHEGILGLCAEFL